MTDAPKSDAAPLAAKFEAAYGALIVQDPDYTFAEWMVITLIVSLCGFMIGCSMTRSGGYWDQAKANQVVLEWLMLFGIGVAAVILT